MTEFDCYEPLDEWDATYYNGTLRSIDRAIQSIALPIFGSFGVISNFIVIGILVKLINRRNENKNRKTFDKMLINLAIFDTLLLTQYSIDSIIQYDMMTEPHWYQVIFLYLCNKY